MTEAIESLKQSGMIRLRQSKAEHEAVLKETCGVAGLQWAASQADYDELCKLARIEFDLAPSNEEDVPGLLALWVAEQLEVDAEEIFGDEPPTDAYARAFFAGAIDYFSEIKSQL
ncbi:MAG: hypothetical protein RL268_1883 [Pseudomonadota bacterium]|jgi:hypothetical protein